MAAPKNPQELLANKEAYYEQVTRMIRWLAIVIAVATFPPGHLYYRFFLIATAAAVIFNGLRYSGLMRWRLFASRLTTLFIDNLLLGVLIVLSGGIHSPYIIFWVFTLISAAYWYGQVGIGLVLSWQIIVTLLASRWHGQIGPTDGVRIIIEEIFALIAIAILAERLTHADRNERQILTAANRQVETERQRMLALINSLADPVIAIDPHNRVSLYNGAALDLLNTNRQLDGASLSDLLVLQDSSGKAVAFEDLLGKPGVVKRSDLILKLGDGSLINLDISLAPIHTDFAARDNYILILRDITKQKTLDQERDEFISVTSHELRTPVAIIEANLSTALMPSFDVIGPKAKELISQAHQNTVFLGQLIKDLSTLSKAEAGRLKVSLEAIDPAALLHSLVEDYRAQAEAKGLSFTVEVGRNLKPFHSSLNLLHEILQNFITNAIKYTQKGIIGLKAELKDGQIVFSVSDSGIGISASDKKKLFTKFYRSEDYRTRQTSGTGLGLYITLRLAQQLGAKIWFKSRLNHGSTFYVAVADQSAESKRPEVTAALKSFVE